MNTYSFFKGIIAIVLFTGIQCCAPPLWAQGQDISERELVEAKTAFIDGLTAFENNDYEEALKLLNKAYVKLPDHPGINFALADAYLQINDLKNAEYYSKQAINLDPENRWYHLQLVDIYRISGQYEAAINELKNALSYHRNDIDILYQLAQTYTEIGQLQQANDIYNKLLQLEGERISIRLERLQIFNRLDQRDSATVELEKIQELEPDNLSTIRLLSNYYLELNQPDKARKALDDALQINPNDPKSVIALSKIYMRQQQWDSLRTTIGPLIEDSTVAAADKIEVAEYIYQEYENNNENNQIRRTADMVFNKLIEADQKSGKAYALAAEFFMDTDQHKQALNALEHTTDLSPTNDTAWKQRLQLLHSERQVDETITVGLQAAEQIPQDPVILYFLGSAYLSNEQYSEAIDHLEEAETLPARKPLKANIYGSLADTYAALENWNEAFNYYQQAVDLDTQNPAIYENYAYHLLRHKKDLSKAQELAHQAVSLDPDNASSLDILGWIYYQKGEFEEARKFLEKAIETGTTDAEIMEHMGDILHKLDRLDEAKEWWQKALDSDTTRTYLKDKISN